MIAPVSPLVRCLWILLPAVLLSLVLLLGRSTPFSERLNSTTLPSATSAAPPEAAAKPHLVASYGKLPLSFEANRGQTDQEVQFLARGPGYTLFLTPTEAVFSLRKPSPSAKGPLAHGPAPPGSGPSWRERE